jgi:hypothetical protein
MSLWQFAACVDGYNRSQGAEEQVSAPSADEYHEMVAQFG